MGKVQFFKKAIPAHASHVHMVDKYSMRKLQDIAAYYGYKEVGRIRCLFTLRVTWMIQAYVVQLEWFKLMWFERQKTSLKKQRREQ